MEIILRPNEVPFMVGDIIWVDQPYSVTSQQSYFQAQIVQIFLAASFSSTIVVKKRQSVHELVISSAMYDLKPVGDHQGSPRQSIEVQFFPPQKKLFGTEEELLENRNQLN